MMTNNQFLFATVCLFTVAMLSGCTTTNDLSDNSDQAIPTEAATEATVTEAPAETIETTATKDSPATTDVVVTAITETTTITEEAETTTTETIPAEAVVTTTENGVVIIPLGLTPPKKVATAATPKKLPATPKTPNIAKALSNHRNTQWHSRSSTYRLYLGGQLNAEYSQEKETLIISADDGNGAMTCEYSTKHGGLASTDESKVAACNKLVNKLQTYLDDD